MPDGVHHLWVPSPANSHPAALTAAARARGIVIGDDTTYWADEPATAHLRLSSGALTPTAITATLDQLDAALGPANSQRSRVELPPF